MGTLLRFNLRQIRQSFGLERLVETGTGLGNSLAWAVRAGFPELHTVEYSAELFSLASQRFAEVPCVHCAQGRSIDFLRELAGAAEKNKPALYFLDAHFLGGADFGLTSYADAAREEDSFPLLDELDILLELDLAHSVIVIDDARIYFNGPFQNGECPPVARRMEESQALVERLGRLAETHATYLLREDEGYLVLAPKGVALDRSMLNILPHDSSGELQYQPGVMGVTGISMQRRLADSRFATRWFCGNGIDVGGGEDSLALYREFFPLSRNIFVYDQAHGDAQLLANVLDESFDFLYSSHCLEHMRDAREALDHWLRVIKPGGHLVIQVPDEDLYEQGEWPSRFNGDHKISFTIAKTVSWSPVSVSLLDLLGDFRDRAEILSLQLLDQGYRRKSLPRGCDQTRTPVAECAIEFVLRKRGAA